MITLSPTGIGDDAAMINAAIASLPTRGGTILLGAGTYDVPAGTIDLNDRIGVTLKGEGGRSPGADTATIIRATGMTRLIDMRSSNGCAVEDMMLACGDNSTGKLVDCSGTDAAPTGYPKVEGCTLVGSPAVTVKGIDLDKAIIGQVLDTRFIQLERGIAGQQPGSFSVKHTIEQNCTFVGTKYPVLYCGEAWSINDNTFEPDLTGKATGVWTLATTPFRGLGMSGNWFGDVTAPGGLWLQLFGDGFTFNGGNRMGGPTDGYGIVIYALKGFTITGNDFHSLRAISFQGGSSDGNVSDNGHNVPANMIHLPLNRGPRVNIARNSGAAEYPYP